MSNVQQFTDVSKQQVDDVVGLLENALSMAKAGVLRDVALTGTMPANRVHTAYSTTDEVKLLGQLDMLKHKLMNALHSKPLGDGDLS
jgi:hypothetical protein